MKKKLRKYEERAPYHHRYNLRSKVVKRGLTGTSPLSMVAQASSLSTESQTFRHSCHESHLARCKCICSSSTEEIAQKLLHDNSNNLQNAVTAFLDNHHKEGECSKPTENGVRAPIPPTRGVLVDDPLPMSSRWTRKRRIQHSVFNHLDQSAGPRRPPADKEVAVNGGAAAAAAEQPRPARRHSKKKKSQILGVMGKSDLQAQREFDAKEMKIQQLTEMYQPPVDMAYNGTQDTVEEEARNKGKLVLVNLQDITDFRCQVINRDVWSKKLLRQFVMQNFIFWQPYLDSPEGDHFLITYNCVHFPFVCCINPWTGKNIHTFRDVHNADRLLAELRQFVRENRFYLHRMYGLKQEADAKKLKKPCRKAKGCKYDTGEVYEVDMFKHWRQIALFFAHLLFHSILMFMWYPWQVFLFITVVPRTILMFFLNPLADALGLRRSKHLRRKRLRRVEKWLRFVHDSVAMVRFLVRLVTRMVAKFVRRFATAALLYLPLFVLRLMLYPLIRTARFFSDVIIQSMLFVLVMSDRLCYYPFLFAEAVLTFLTNLLTDILFLPRMIKWITKRFLRAVHRFIRSVTFWMPRFIFIFLILLHQALFQPVLFLRKLPKKIWRYTRRGWKLNLKMINLAMQAPFVIVAMIISGIMRVLYLLFCVLRKIVRRLCSFLRAVGRLPGLGFKQTPEEILNEFR